MKVTILIVTHEMRFARDVSDRIVVFDWGATIEQGVLIAFLSILKTSGPDRSRNPPEALRSTGAAMLDMAMLPEQRRASIHPDDVDAIQQIGVHASVRKTCGTCRFAPSDCQSAEDATSRVAEFSVRVSIPPAENERAHRMPSLGAVAEDPTSIQLFGKCVSQPI
ncbi:hypothetical protein [Mesorhizobium sp. B4-1-4]|uniref:hypothetical protein n=1 Tax=Mesorhizobium sp. B4-1-4 TaxID=2589888 RepID=UPI00112BC527|nr:hypothetical protein [Mesorhizobium sp. B4-1-4]UCI31700.1 hypothetical protein FJW03_28735 [Mesorhizobium sp. B4-1-4]